MIAEEIVMEETAVNLTGLERLSQRVAARIEFGDWIWLQGPLGAGKTTFVRSVLRAWGFQGVVSSPTYLLVKEYEIWDRHIVHLDAYRLEPHSELPFDIREWTDAIVFVEWAERLGWDRTRFKYRIELGFSGAADQESRDFRLISLRNS